MAQVCQNGNGLYLCYDDELGLANLSEILKYRIKSLGLILRAFYAEKYLCENVDAGSKLEICIKHDLSSARIILEKIIS